MVSLLSDHAFEGFHRHLQPPLEQLGLLSLNDGMEHHRGLLNLTMMPRYENASAFHQTEWVDVDTISITLVANIVLCLLALVYFWSSRRHHPGCFSSKRFYLPDHTPPDLPSAGFLSWIFPLMSMPEEDILTYAGFDAAIFLRFYSLAFKVFALFTPYGLLVLIPVNMKEVPVGSEDVRHESSINTFNKLSMSNIQHYDSRMWLHALGVYLLSTLAMHFLVVEYRYYTRLRHRFLRRKSAHLRTIVVEGVPKEMRSDSKLFTYFNTLYPDEVVNVHIPQNLRLLRSLIRERQSVLENLGRCLAERGVRGEEQYHYTGVWCFWRRRVNTVDYCSLRLERLNLAISNEQDQRMPRRRRRLGWGPSLPSISSVDISYDLGAKPDREAGPIERVVLQEDPGEDLDMSDSQGSDERRARIAGASVSPPGSREPSSATASANSGAAAAADSTAGVAGIAGVTGNGTSTGDAASPPGGGRAAATVSPDDSVVSATAAAKGSLLSPKFEAMESGGVHEAIGGGARANGRGGRGPVGPGGGREAREIGVGGQVGEKSHPGRAAGKEDGADSGAAAAKTMQQHQEAYWGKGQQTAKGGSPRGVYGTGWGSPDARSRPPPQRLSVDLINVDPVKEAVKNTAQQTLNSMRVSTFQYRVRGREGYGATPGQRAGNGNGGGGGGGAGTSGLALAKARLGGLFGRYSKLGSSSSGSSSAMVSPASTVVNDGGLGGRGGKRGTSSSGRGGLLWSAGGGGSGAESASLLPGPGQQQQQQHHHHHNRRPVKKRGGYSSRAFVTFRSFSAATVARQVLHCARPGRMAASSAPEPWDVYWPNAIVTRRQHTVRRLCVEILLAFLMLLFPALMSFLSFSLSAESIMQRSAVVKALCQRSSLFQSMIQLIQPMCVIAVMATLPLVLRWVGHFEGILAESWIQMQTLSRFFTFQVLNVFLVTTIAGFAVEILTRQFQAQIVQRLVDKPAVLFTLLGETLPKVCGFFCDYVIIRAFSGMSMELVRAYSLLPAVLALMTSKKKWGRAPYRSSAEDRRQRFDSLASNGSSGLGGTVNSADRVWGNPRSRAGSQAATATHFNGARRPLGPSCFYYGQVYAQDLLVVVVVMTYACIAPAVLIPALMFFAMAQLVYRHQLLYVYVPTFESGGSFFPKMFRRWIFALFTAQATMVGMCLLKQGFNQAYSVMFLMVLTYAYKRKVRSMYEPVSFSLPLEIARALDLDRAESGPEGREEDEALHPAAKEYLQPELREPAFVGPEDILGGAAGGSPDETFG